MLVRVPLQGVTPVHPCAPNSNFVWPEYQDAGNFLPPATQINISVHHLEEGESRRSGAPAPSFTTEHAVDSQAQIIASDFFLVRWVTRNHRLERRPRQCQHLNVGTIGPRCMIFTQEIVMKQQLVHPPDRPPGVNTGALSDRAPVKHVQIPRLREILIGLKHERRSLCGYGGNAVHPHEAEEPHLANPRLARCPLNIGLQHRR
mmetsp:Transcript_56237/g.123171  ORF Transcript_56237/g.123171 Transcript_56237/m.123171 type:complete len:203 (-) Transcript_56237:412-1020(-)